MTMDNLHGQVQARLNSLTKPIGSLGRLEDIALRFALIKGEVMPQCARKAIYVFCADHGITEEGVSLYPSEVTAQMVANFLAGGAAINVLCRQYTIEPVIVDVGVKGQVGDGALRRKVAHGTHNFARGPAMLPFEAEQSLRIGSELAQEAASRFDVAGLGEMGIGNTTSAAALLSVFAGADPADAAGPGTGLTREGVARKAEVIRLALARHRLSAKDPMACLAAVGGLEIGAMAGFLIEAARLRLAVVLDGFITCSAALMARAIDKHALDTAFFAHVSAERGHRLMLDALGGQPFLDLGMRLGEGSGAALGINLIETAVRLYTEMATFGEAGVSEG